MTIFCLSTSYRHCRHLWSKKSTISASSSSSGIIFIGTIKIIIGIGLGQRFRSDIARDWSDRAKDGSDRAKDGSDRARNRSNRARDRSHYALVRARGIGIGLRINNARRTVLARVSGLVFGL